MIMMGWATHHRAVQVRFAHQNPSPGGAT